MLTSTIIDKCDKITLEYVCQDVIYKKVIAETPLVWYKGNTPLLPGKCKRRKSAVVADSHI